MSSPQTAAEQQRDDVPGRPHQKASALDTLREILQRRTLCKTEELQFCAARLSDLSEVMLTVEVHSSAFNHT